MISDISKKIMRFYEFVVYASMFAIVSTSKIFVLGVPFTI